MKTSLIVLSFVASFFVRALRWLGVVQQKEYRLDRLLLFLFSREGIKELLRLLPKKTDFSQAGLKRPKITNRSLLLTLVFIFLTLTYFKLGMDFGLEYMLSWYPYPLWYRFALFVLLMLVYLITIPLFAMFSVIPTVLLAYVQTYKRLMQAKKLLDEKKPIVIGITGSYGKTSTKILLAHVLEKKYKVFYTPKSFNTKYSVAHSVVTGYLGEDIAIIEYAAYKKGEIKELTKWIRPETAIITGLAKQHVGLFGSIEQIIKAKSELVASLPKNALVICNVYDPETQKIYDVGSSVNNAKLIAVGPDVGKVRLVNPRINDEGKLQFSWDEKTVRTQLMGIQYRELIHLVIVAALQFKIPKDEIIDALESFTPDEKFIQTYSLNSGAKVVDDGDTSNPKGFLAIIDLAKSIKAVKKILITPGIVDLGRDSREVHLELAKKAKKVFDKVIFVGDSGQTEFKVIFSGELLSHREQLKEIISTLDKDDLVVIEGRMPPWAKQFLEK